VAKFKPYLVNKSFEIKLEIDEVVDKDHLCRKIEYLVSALDTSDIESKFSSIGQNAYHPKMMLSIIFYGYVTGIRSGRKLAQACKENLPYIYLSKSYYPQKTALNKFRMENFLHFQGLFVQVIKMAEKQGLADFSFSVGDGSKIEANSSKRRTKTEQQFSKWNKSLLDDIADIEQELEEEQTSEIEREQIEKTIESKKKLGDKINAAIEVLSEDDTKKRVNLTDPDAPLMKGKKGNFDTYYNVQTVCNEDKFIGCCYVVTEGNDKAQLIPMINGIKKNTGKNIDILLADADYDTYDSIEYMSKENIKRYVPYRDMNTAFDENQFHSSHFKYQEETDSYICPNNEELKFRREREDKRRNQRFKDYRSDKCKSCEFQKQCCPKNVARRVISRELRQGLRDEMKQRLNSEEGKKVYKRRLHPIESIFGHLKYNLGYTNFLLRGLEKVNAEFTIMCLSYNLKKLAKYVKSLNILVNKRYGLFICRFQAFICKVILCEKNKKKLMANLQGSVH